MGILNPVRPFPHGFGDGILQGCGSGCDRNDFCAQKAHPVDVESLTDGIFFAHEYDAFHTHEGCGRRGGYTVLTGAGFRDQAGFTNFFSKKCLAKDIVDLMSAGMVQILPFQVDLSAAQVLCHLPGIIEPGRASGVVVQKIGKFPLKIRIFFIMIICLFQFNYRVHQRFGDILPAVNAEASVRIGHGISSFHISYSFNKCFHFRRIFFSVGFDS